MNPLGVLIVDDEPLARARLTRQLQSIEGCELLGEAANAQDALIKFELLDPDVLLLDIEMPGQSGLELGHELSQLNNPPALIFCTAHDQFALPAFTTAAVGYLLKPITSKQLTAAIIKARQLNKPQLQLSQSIKDGPRTLPGRRQIKVISSRGIQLLAVDDIRCLVADSKYVVAHHTEGETILDESLKELELEFGQRFVRVHRNALVAEEFLAALHKGGGNYRVQLKGVTIQPLVSRRLLPAVKKWVEGQCFV